MSQCPDCGGKLGTGAMKCRCGWGKPMLPTSAPNVDPGHIQCADDSSCRKPGRMWVEGMEAKARVCVEHYYARLDRK